MSNIYETFSKDIIDNRKMIYENRRMIYKLIITLLRKGLLTTEEANQITSKEVKDELKDKS